VKHSKSSRRWLDEHFKDTYVKRAQQAGYRSRAAFKLLEMQEKDRLLTKGMTVVDLGSAPGGWSIVAQRLVGDKGRVFAVDILPMAAIAGVNFIQGDFQEDAVFQQLLTYIDNQPVNLVMSDIAPNISGIIAVDQPRIMYLAELALDLAQKVLSPGGNFLVKVFQGEGFVEFMANMRKSFSQVKTRKPAASRSRSNEVYLLGVGFKA
jgi:23S rRNA (uridine2552-2'-O)-methyltransferase